jgi:hypothetical protein
MTDSENDFMGAINIGVRSPTHAMGVDRIADIDNARRHGGFRNYFGQ